MNAEQLDLDAYRTDLADSAAEHGMQRAVRGDPDGYTRALEAIEQLAASGRSFVADDVRGILGHGGSVIGSAFRTAARRNIIRATGEVVSSVSMSRHSGLQRVWQGTS